MREWDGLLRDNTKETNILLKSERLKHKIREIYLIRNISQNYFENMLN